MKLAMHPVSELSPDWKVVDSESTRSAFPAVPDSRHKYGEKHLTSSKQSKHSDVDERVKS